MERIRLEYERNQQIQQEIQERKRINRKELKLNELKRQKDLENLFSTIPPTIKETKSSIVRVKSVRLLYPTLVLSYEYLLS